MCSEHDYSRNKVRGQGYQGHSDPKMVCDTLPSQDASHAKFGIPTSNNVGDMLQT